MRKLSLGNMKLKANFSVAKLSDEQISKESAYQAIYVEVPLSQ